jgi:hypothetical protein
LPSRTGAAHVATTRRRYKDRVYQTYLLRQSYREGDSVRHRTLAKPLPYTIAKNRLQIKSAGGATSEMTTTQTALQQRAFDLL